MENCQELPLVLKMLTMICTISAKGLLHWADSRMLCKGFLQFPNALQGFFTMFKERAWQWFLALAEIEPLTRWIPRF